MHDIRTLFAGLGDLHNELTVLGRYLLTVIDQESELLQCRLMDVGEPLPCGTPVRSADRDLAWTRAIDAQCI